MHLLCSHGEFFVHTRLIYLLMPKDLNSFELVGWNIVVYFRDDYQYRLLPLYLHTVTSNAKNKRYQHESLFSKLHQVNRKNFSDKYRGRVTRLPQFALSQLHMRFCPRNSPDQHIHHIHLVLKYSHLDSTDVRISNISYKWSSKTLENEKILNPWLFMV